MVVTILLLLLIVLASLALHFFLFSIFIPSLKEQHVDAENPVFSKEEIDFEASFFNDEDFGVPGILNIPEQLLSEKDIEIRKKEPEANKKVFSFWKKCYNIFLRK